MFDRPTATIYRFPVADKSSLPVPASATEESGSTPITGKGAVEAKEEPRAFLQSGRRHLKEEELDSPGVRRFLIAEIERLDQHCAELNTFRDQYHNQRVELATLRESAKKSITREILSTLCISLGFAGVSAAPNYLAVAGAERFVWIVIGFSVVLIGGGLLTKVWK